MKKRLVIILITLLVLSLFTAMLLACEDNTTEEAAIRTLKSIEVKQGSTVTMYEGETFNPAAYSIIATLDNDSTLEVQLSAGMFVADELSGLDAGVGTYALTITYSLNNSSKSILMTVRILEEVVVAPKYTVTLDIGDDGIVYSSQARTITRTVSQLSTITLPMNVGYEYMSAEWYRSSGFESASKVSFPYEIQSDQTLYAKWVDNRRYTVRYHIVRQNGAQEVDASGEVTSRELLPTYTSLTVNNLKYPGAVTSTPLADSVALPTSFDAIAGYTFADRWEIRNFALAAYDVLTPLALGGTTFNLTSDYIEDTTALEYTLDVYCIFTINYYTVSFENSYGVYSLAEEVGATVDGTDAVIGDERGKIDVFGNVRLQDNMYKVRGGTVYNMTEEILTGNTMLDGNGTMTFAGTTYYFREGIGYIDSAYTTQITDNIVTVGVTRYYMHAPILTYRYNYELKALDLPYIIPKVGKNSSWQYNGISFPEVKYVTSDIRIVAADTDRMYTVSFYRYDGTSLGTLTKAHNTSLTPTETSNKALLSGTAASGYSYWWEINGSGTYNDTQLLSYPIVQDLEIRENRSANSYTNVFKHGGTEDPLTGTTVASIATDFAQTVNLPTAAQIRAAVAVYDYDYYTFEWYTNSTLTLKLENRATQGDGASVYYLKAIDDRKLKLTFVLDGTYSNTGVDQTSAEETLSMGESYSLNMTNLGLVFANQYRQKSSAGYELGGATFDDLSQITFGDTFITTHSLVLAADNTYGVVIRIYGETKTFSIHFEDEVGSSFTQSVDYGVRPSAAAYSTIDKTIGGVVYRFAGWYDTTLSNYQTEFAVATGDATYRAVWTTDEEGSFGIEYSPVYSGETIIGFEAVGYTGFSNKVYIGSKYMYNGTEYDVIRLAQETFSLPLAQANSDVEITYVYIPATVAMIEEGSFTDCYYLTKIEVSPTNADYLSIDDVLYMRSNGTDYTLVCYPQSKTGSSYALDPHTTAIAAEAFTRYSGTAIDWGTSTVSVIGNRAFKASSLTAVSLPATLRVLGQESFSNCNALASVTLLGSLGTLTKVGAKAFEGTPYLNSLRNTPGEITLGYVLLEYTGTAPTWQLSNSIITIADEAVYGLNTLTEITITSGTGLIAANIGEKVFAATDSLAEVHILNTVLYNAVVADKDRIFIDTNSGLIITNS